MLGKPYRKPGDNLSISRLSIDMIGIVAVDAVGMFIEMGSVKN